MSSLCSGLEVAAFSVVQGCVQSCYPESVLAVTAGESVCVGVCSGVELGIKC